MEEKIESGIYAYCVAASDRVDSLDCAGAHDNAQVRSQLFDDLRVVYSHANLYDFTGETGDANLRDIEWVGPRAVAHERVVRHVMKTSPVYPFGFATIFSSMESLEGKLKPLFSDISRFLRKIDGKSEYSLKGYLVRKKALDFLSERFFSLEQQALEGMSPGKRYFAEQKLARKIESAAEAWSKEACESFLNPIVSRFEEYSERKTLSSDVCGVGLEMVFNLAFLIEDGDRETFGGMIAGANAELEDGGLSITMTGPWPPYSFCKDIDGRKP